MNEKILYLTSPIPPSVNHYMGHRAIIKNGKPLSVNYSTNEAKKYKASFSKYVLEEVKKQNWDLIPNGYQHFYIDTVFYFDRSHKDPNNYYKLMLDAITDTRAIWLDDDTTCERVQGIFYDPVNPRVELIIHPVDYIGVFEDASQLQEFESNCIGCKRYKRNCSLLNKAKLGIIQEEIQDNQCSKFAATQKGDKQDEKGNENDKEE